jgi:SAM-dependent methyltransferase
MAATPHNVAWTGFAPARVRAFTRQAYDAVGGYAQDLEQLEDEDLMMRLYSQGEFLGTGTLEYLHRARENVQPTPDNLASIQSDAVDLYERNIQNLALAWTQREQLRSVELGCGWSKYPAYDYGVDLCALDDRERADQLGILAADLEVESIPFDDDSVGLIRTVDFLEHLRDSRRIMDEIWRVLAPGGMLLSLTPSTDGRGAFQDPTHVSFWNANSFWYYTDPMYAQYSPQHSTNRARFQVSTVRTYFPSDWYAANNISYVQANLIAIKPGTLRSGGPLLW